MNRKQRNILLFGGIGGIVLVAIVILCLTLMTPGMQAADAKASPTPESLPLQINSPSPDPVSEQQEAELQSILARTTMLSGVTINDVDVSGMTLDAAKNAVEAALNAKKTEFQMSVIDGENSYVIAGNELSFDSNLDEVLNEAFALARNDLGYDEVMELVSEIAERGVTYNAELTLNEESIRNYANSLAEKCYVAPVDATMTVDIDTNTLVYSDEVAGSELDREQFVTAVLEAYSNGNTELSAPMLPIEPEHKRADIENMYGLRGSYKTKVSGSKNRKFNVGYGAGMINGSILKPGEVFSANDTLGVRSTANGWKAAPAYVAGAHEDQPGGGVCQLSSTLYNAVVLSDLEIVDRINHSMPVGYVSKGRDATINSVGNIIDFKFRNNTEGDIIILCRYSGNYLYMDIYGLPFVNDEYDSIDIRVVKRKTMSITTEYINDPTLPVGYEEETYEGSTGYVYDAYKQFIKDGKVVREEKLNTSTYRMYPRTVVRGTNVSAVTPTPGATPTEGTEPVDTPSPTTPPTDPPATPEPFTTDGP